MPPSRMVTLDSDVFKCCQKVETIGQNNDSEAKSILQRAADQVKPIMARRKWAVALLTEFYPPMTNLLGMNHNHGEKIEIRLRSPSNRDKFLSYESILGTLLHELAHIEVGPHNAQFYKLLDELQDECDTLIARGSTLSSFGNGSGGTRLSHGQAPPKHLAKERAIAAANRRQKINQLMPKGGRVLGGDQQLSQIGALCDPREMALAAAQRRLLDEVWCSSSSSNPVSNFPGSSSSSAGGGNGIIDVDAIDDDDEVMILEETKSNVLAPSRLSRRSAPQRPRVSSTSVPVRENPAAMAALQRAQERQLEIRQK